MLSYVLVLYVVLPIFFNNAADSCKRLRRIENVSLTCDPDNNLTFNEHVAMASCLDICNQNQCEGFLAEAKYNTRWCCFLMNKDALYDIGDNVLYYSPAVSAQMRPPCSSNPCLNAGSCVESGSTFQCICSYGYQGNLCGDEENLCSTFGCPGECQDGLFNFTCRYQGKNAIFSTSQIHLRCVRCQCIA